MLTLEFVQLMDFTAHFLKRKRLAFVKSNMVMRKRTRLYTLDPQFDRFNPIAIAFIFRV
jgi:hypothetical protein